MLEKFPKETRRWYETLAKRRPVRPKNIPQASWCLHHLAWLRVARTIQAPTTRPLKMPSKDRWCWKDVSRIRAAAVVAAATAHLQARLPRAVAAVARESREGRTL